MPITHLELDRLLASTDPAEFSARRKLEDVGVAIAKAKKVVVVSGAGISCSSGIPDFRSADGLYSLVKRRYPDAFVTGKDLFSSGLFLNPATTSIFLTFIAELALACAAATPTRTHHFIHKLDKAGKLLRSYTQNVDGFERRLGMESGGRGAGLHKRTTRNVELHGDLGRVRCTLCMHDYAAREEWVSMFREGEAPSCPTCEERCTARLKRAARATPIGTLRPSIVLYDEPHPLGDEIGALHAHDAGRAPDVLLIMGTSLKVSGLKALVRDFARAVHAGTGAANRKKGLVVFVNATKPGKEWEGVIDVHVQGETDTWVEKVEEVWRRVKPADWEVQTRLDMGVVKDVRVEVKEKGKVTGAPKGKGKGESDEGAELMIVPILPPTPRPSTSPERDCVPSSTPPAPISPSKRRVPATPDSSAPTSRHTSPTKRSRPATGVPGTPGKGNLFATASLSSLRSDEWESIEDTGAEGDEVFGSPARAAPVRVARPASRARASRTGGAKENVAPRAVAMHQVKAKARGLGKGAAAAAAGMAVVSPLKPVIVGTRATRARSERAGRAVMRERRGVVNA